MLVGPRILDSRSELSSLVAVDENSFILNYREEAAREFLIFEIALSDMVVRVGLEVCQLGGGRQCWISRSEKIAFFGSDKNVHVVNLAAKSIVSKYPLEAVFFEFIDVEDTLLAFHELGVVAFSFDGRALWTFSANDIVVSWKVVGDSVHLLAADGSEPKLAIKDGRLSN